MKDNPGFIQVDSGTTIWTGDEKLTFVRLQFAAALRTVERTEGGIGGYTHGLYFNPYMRYFKTVLEMAVILILVFAKR